MTLLHFDSSLRFAWFDLDRTLIRGDSASLWVRYQRDRGKANALDLVRVAYWMAQYSVGLVNARAVAERVLEPYRDYEERQLAAESAQFVHERVLPLVSASARRRIEEHRTRGHELAIVTSATRYVALPVARALGIEGLVCSELEVQEGRLTGRFVAPLCYREGKLARARVWAEQRQGSVREAVFYSDSNTDTPLLEAVGAPVLVNPDWVLRRANRRRAWPCERWV